MPCFLFYNCSKKWEPGTQEPIKIDVQAQQKGQWTENSIYRKTEGLTRIKGIAFHLRDSVSQIPTGWDPFQSKHFHCDFSEQWVGYLHTLDLKSYHLSPTRTSPIALLVTERVTEWDFHGGPSSQVLHSVLGQFKFKPVEKRYFKVTGSY